MKINKRLLNKDVLTPIFSIAVILFVIVVYKNYENSNRQDLLKKYKFNFGIVSGKTNSQYGSSRISILHKLRGQEFEAKAIEVKNSCFNKIKIGDTVFIKYSKKDPSIVKIETCYWNRKLQLIKIK